MELDMSSLPLVNRKTNVQRNRDMKKLHLEVAQRLGIEHLYGSL